MNILIAVYIIILGLLLGSFFNVCIFRIPRGESIAFPPSHCTNCNNKINGYDLIPVISYILLKGKCRYCGEKISLRYPAVEIVTAVLFYLVYLNYGLTFFTIKFIVLVSLLMVIGMIDFDTTDVYFSTTIIGIVCGIGFIIAGYFMNLGVIEFILGGVAAGGFIAVIILITRGMGWGDAEICFMCGLFLGLKLSIVMLFLSFIIGGIIGIALIALKIKNRKDYIPFGPFIAISSLLTLFFGQYIVNYYISMF
ncbi:A24 family peptidase [Clostridium sp.]|jgi:leader peptidase (prepilin peptidase)/N-methyltransferase|uniref:prepilin peptidase n=1 Tax=Clostridium sp. TaxID=1506 RepID=UPI0025875460|nr:A24 family peptidase [Clostridium sp.]MDF2503006.1 prepilin signal peptidase PulO-like peptidase [Clostridium sp.]